MKIRTLTFEDLEEAAKIEAACFRQNWSRAVLEESFCRAWNLFFGAEEGGRLAAYGCASVIAGEGEILRIAVLEGFRHQGIGRELLEAMEQESIKRGAKMLMLEVRESNLAARKLYLHAGFSEEGQRKEYYREPKEDAIIMWKRNL